VKQKIIILSVDHFLVDFISIHWTISSSHRYKACKESAENLYARLAALSALQSYGIYLPTLMAAVTGASTLPEQVMNNLDFLFWIF